jgi:outer membrane protein OmpA-like peptidoglycan-associated protein
LKTLLLCSLLLSSAAAQPLSQTLLGTWHGITTQPNGVAAVPNFSFWIEFRQDPNGGLTARTRCEVPGYDYYAIMDAKVSLLANNDVHVTETRILQNKLYPQLEWCLKTLRLHYNPATNTASLKGSYSGTSSTGSCDPGDATLFKTNVAFNATTAPTQTYISMDELNRRLQKKESVTGTKIVLDHVYFQPSSAALDNTSIPALLKVVQLLRLNPAVRIQINGHTDNVPGFSDEYCLRLSIDRAKSVREYIVQQNISARQVDYEGFGKSRPRSSSTDEASRQLNRRTEFEIVGQ